jgi:hypothetical protein
MYYPSRLFSAMILQRFLSNTPLSMIRRINKAVKTFIIFIINIHIIRLFKKAGTLGVSAFVW